jgi:hypothetical protein
VVAVAEPVDLVVLAAEPDRAANRAGALVMRGGEVLADRPGVGGEEVGARIEVLHLELQVQVLIVDEVAHPPVIDLPVGAAERAEPVLKPVGVGQRRGAVASVAQAVTGDQAEPESGNATGVVGLVADAEDPADARRRGVPRDEHAVLPPLLARIGLLPALGGLGMLHVTAHRSPHSIQVST